ncbi:MAG: hypothetical protein KJ811_04585, partial [Candidatus Margulisbacteria bacterium]|nr:hypothetical protein [Candidatus Margulisiibacteriota bacterium]
LYLAAHQAEESSPLLAAQLTLMAEQELADLCVTRARDAERQALNLEGEARQAQYRIAARYYGLAFEVRENNGYLLCNQAEAFLRAGEVAAARGLLGHALLGAEAVEEARGGLSDYVSRLRGWSDAVELAERLPEGDAQRVALEAAIENLTNLSPIATEIPQAYTNLTTARRDAEQRARIIEAAQITVSAQAQHVLNGGQ